ncbi:MAG: hypothetical protein ACLFUL_16655 [Desulfobacteraceae bacterium]
MDLITKHDIKTLLEKRSAPCISMYIPMVQKGPETRQNQIRFGNALREAENELNRMMSHKDASDILDPAKALLEETWFWSHQSNGLAVYLSGDFFRRYRVDLRLEELVTVGSRFHLKPILPLFHAGARFYVLALSQNRVQLLRCTPYSSQVMDLPSVPSDLSSALQYEETESQLQFHTGTPQGRGNRPAAFHGQGVGKDDKKDQVERFLRTVDRSLWEAVLRNEEIPLVAACVDYLFAIYQKVNSYPHLLDTPVTGNPDEKSPKDLQEQAWEVVEPYFQKFREAAVREFEEFKHTERTSNDLRKILPASFEGRVKHLLVDPKQILWGTFDPENDQVILHDSKEPGDQGLVDLASVETIIRGGTVYALGAEEMPGDSPVTAVFRY